MNALMLDLADYVRELTQTHQHREHYTVRRGAFWVGANHTTKVPALIHQLQYAAPSGQGDDRSGAGFGSRPAARIEALDCLQRIDRDAAWWVRRLGEDDPGDTIRVVQVLHGLRPRLAACDKRRAGCCDAHELEHDVRRWWTQARIVTGWDSPAWRPDNTCPLCSVRGGLRVKLADQTGFCAECGETWTPETLGLLADHIRGENAEDQDQGHDGREAS